MLSQMNQDNELGNTDWHVVTEKTVPVETQQDDVDDAVDVPVVITKREETWR